MATFEVMFFQGIVVFCCIFGIGILISAYSRHREKKSPITKTLLILHIYLVAFIFVSLVSTLFHLFDIPVISGTVTESTFPLGDRVLILCHTFFYQFAVIFLLCAFNYYYVFTRIVFGGGKSKKWIVIMIFVTIINQVGISAIILYSLLSVMSGLPVNYELVSLGVALMALLGGLILLAANCIISIPVFRDSIHLWKRTPKEDPNKSNALYIGIMALLNILSIIFTIVDIVLARYGGVAYPTIAFVIAWLCVPLIIYTAYRGYFSRKSEKKIP
ncbi:MAG: hypothetical protein RBG13Loki_1101 [Promethearchaeota archaeon CR_4]|nr:MAG: hypothetical protein RBG13Loki_1101 [Candidatus Lokiarchaeota archaeon CR_4]